MKKFKIFCDFDEEEHWLTEMGKQGHFLKSYSCFGYYTFFESTPQSLNYKVDYKLFRKTKDYASYLALFDDAGWQHICGTQAGGSHYFIPKNTQAGTEIFSDTASANGRYKSLLKICISFFVVWMIYCLSILNIYDFDFQHLVFMTPGLWKMSGLTFLRSFLIELPFAIVRVGALAYLLGTAIYYGYWTVKAYRSYHRKLKESKL